jgi:hypothetical protein
MAIRVASTFYKYGLARNGWEFFFVILIKEG